MRTTLIVLSMAAMTGCASEPASFDYRSTFDHESRGLVLHSQGETGHAGMYGTNCPFETNHGGVTGDTDLPDKDEELQDHGVTALGPNSVLAVIEDTVHMFDKTTGSYVLDAVDVPGVDRVRIWDEGLVATVSTDAGCAVVWTGSDRASVELPSCPDQHQFTTDPATGTAVGAIDGQVVVVDEQGLHMTGVAADLVAWDASTQQIYAATRGQHDFVALDPSGADLWTIQTDNPVRGFAAAGIIGHAAVTLERSDGMGELAMFDGSDGALLGLTTTPQPADTVVVSANGAMIGIVLPGRTHFFATAPWLQ